MTRCVEHGWTRNRKSASMLTTFTKILPGVAVVKEEEFKESSVGMLALSPGNGCQLLTPNTGSSVNLQSEGERCCTRRANFNNLEAGPEQETHIWLRERVGRGNVKANSNGKS